MWQTFSPPFAILSDIPPGNYVTRLFSSDMVKEEECICRASVTAMRTIDGDLCQRVVPLFAYLARWTMNIACWGKAQILNAKVPYILQTGFQIAVGSTVSDIAGNTKYFVPHNTYARCHSACKTHSIIRNRSALRRTLFLRYVCIFAYSEK